MAETNQTISVCMLVTDIDAPSGGVQTNSRTLLRELNERGVQTFACVRNYYRRPPREMMAGTEIHRSPVWGRSRAVNSILYLVSTFVWLLRNRDRYDVIHCQQMFGPTMAATIASFLIAKPIVVRITTVGELGEVKRIREMPLAWVRLRLIRRVSRWVALTREMADELETLDIPSESINIIHNSTQIPERAAFEPSVKESKRRTLGINYAKIAVFAGRLSEEKGLDVLIDAWQAILRVHADAHLLILGEGGEYRNVESDLRRQCADLGLGANIHFVGHVENTKDFILASDVFVLPSRTEGMSNALVEAFACGAAIVASHIRSNLEICDDGINSLLVPVADTKGFADAIIRVFGSPGLGHGLGEEARKKAERELSVEAMVDEYLSTYRQTLK